jgi:hypothetical protein
MTSPPGVSTLKAVPAKASPPGCDELQRHASGAVMQRRVRDLAGLDLHVGALDRVRIAIGRDDVIGALRQADELAGLGVGDDRDGPSELPCSGTKTEKLSCVRGDRAVADRAGQRQPAGADRDLVAQALRPSVTRLVPLAKP